MSTQAWVQTVVPDRSIIDLTKIDEKCQNQNLLSDVCFTKGANFGKSKLLNLVKFGANFDYIEM